MSFEVGISFFGLAQLEPMLMEIPIFVALLKKRTITMEEQFVEEKTFEKKDFSENRLKTGEYDTCVFSVVTFPIPIYPTIDL